MTDLDLRDILADLSTAQRALRQSSDSFNDALAGMDTTMRGISLAIDAVRAANTAQGAAIDAVIAATDRALRLVTTDGGSH